MIIRVVVLLSVFLNIALLSSGCTQKTAIATPGEIQNSPGYSGSVIDRGVNKYGSTVDVRLEGVNDSVIAEIFGKVLNSATTIISAKRYSSQIIPDNPQASWVKWSVTTDTEADVFYLQTEMMEMFKEIISAGGYVDMYSVPYRYGSPDIALLKGIRPMSATSRSITFILDRELMRDREMAGN